MLWVLILFIRKYFWLICTALGQHGIYWKVETVKHGQMERRVSDINRISFNPYGYGTLKPIYDRHAQHGHEKDSRTSKKR